MNALRRLPIRVRLIAAFAAGMAVLLAAVGVFVYVRMSTALLEATDAGLRSRADVLIANVQRNGPELVDIGASLIERDEAFAQIADASGRIVGSSPIVEHDPLLPPRVITGLHEARFFDRRIAPIDDVTRVLAVPVVRGSTRAYVLVGSSLQDRRDQLIQLAATLAVGEPIALVMISLAGWALARAALRPIERMRRDAASVSTSDPVRLPVPDRDDEVARLGRTLNEMLDRIQGSFERERRLLDNAAHELRTPLAILKAEVDLALSKARTVEDLTGALRSVAEETDHIGGLAEDLLVMARLNGGAPAPVPVEASVSELLIRTSERHAAHADAIGVAIVVDAPPMRARFDRARLRQALDNLVDNALRYTPPTGEVRLSARSLDGRVEIEVVDTGPGFAPGVHDRAFEPFARGTVSHAEHAGSGLGLAVVRTIAEAHGGGASIENLASGGARVVLWFPSRDRTTVAAPAT
jgi:signal transduction histidine kinase